MKILRCHCGLVEGDKVNELDKILKCNCSICKEREQ